MTSFPVGSEGPEKVLTLDGWRKCFVDAKLPQVL